MIKTIQGDQIKCNLQELAVPSLNMGAMTSDDTELRSKPTGSLGEFNHIGKDEYQVAYEKPVSQNPIGIAPNNPTTGEFHLNGEFWKSNQNDIDSGNVSQMADMLKQRGFENISQNILDQLRSGYEWEFNQLTRKDKFVAMQVTVDNLAKNPRYYDELDNVIVQEGETPIAEMWIGSIPKDRLNIRHGWPAGLKKSKKDSGEQKEAEVVEEEEELKRITHHVKAMNEKIEAGEGQSIVLNSYVAELDAEFKRGVSKKSRYGKGVLLEAINTLIQEEENKFWSKALLECPAVPLSTSNFKNFRRQLLSQIKTGCFNEKLKKLVEEKEQVIKNKAAEPEKETDTDVEEEEAQMDEMSTSAGAGSFSPANWVSRDPRGNVKSAETLGYRLSPAKKEKKQDPHYWKKHHRIDPRNKFGKTRDVLGTDGRKLDNLDEALRMFRGLPTEAKKVVLKTLKETLKRKRPFRENSFDPAGGGSAGSLAYSAPLATQNSAYQSPDHFGNAVSPNTETSSSLNGAEDRMIQPQLGTEDPHWSGNSYT